MAHLQGHATDRPGLRNEPRALAATDHTAQRARQGRGRRTIRRRVSGECAAWGRTAGSLIPHAGAVRPLMIAMIEAPFGTAAMALARGADAVAACRRATRRRAIRVTPITGRADREETVAASADFLAKRRVHDVGAAARFDWTRLANRGTRERRLARSVGASRRSPRAWRYQLQALTSDRRRPQLTQQAPHRESRRGCGR